MFIYDVEITLLLICGCAPFHNGTVGSKASKNSNEPIKRYILISLIQFFIIRPYIERNKGNLTKWFWTWWNGNVSGVLKWLTGIYSN